MDAFRPPAHFAPGVPPFFSGTSASLRSLPAKPRGFAALPKACCENPHIVEDPDGSQERMLDGGSGRITTSSSPAHRGMGGVYCGAA